MARPARANTPEPANEKSAVNVDNRPSSASAGCVVMSAGGTNDLSKYVRLSSRITQNEAATTMIQTE